MDDDRDAFAGMVHGEDEVGDSGAVDPGFVDEAEANATEQENASAVSKRKYGLS